MTVAVPSREEGAVVPSPVTAAEAAALPADDILARLGSGTTGLTEDQAARRLRAVGPNAVHSHRVHALSVLASQLRSPLLILLAVTALASARRIPFFRSRPSLPLTLAALAVVTIGAVLPYTGRLARILGFRPLPGPFFLFLIAAIVCYLALIEVGKYWFYRSSRAPAAPAPRHRRRGYRVRRRASRFTTRTLRPARRPVEGNAPNAPAV